MILILICVISIKKFNNKDTNPNNEITNNNNNTNENNNESNNDTTTENTNTGADSNTTTGNTDTSANTNTATGNNPQTGDNIIIYLAILIIATIGIIMTTKVNKNIKE